MFLMEDDLLGSNPLNGDNPALAPPTPVVLGAFTPATDWIKLRIKYDGGTLTGTVTKVSDSTQLATISASDTAGGTKPTVAHRYCAFFLANTTTASVTKADNFSIKK